jgi:hypothetical protein
MFICKKGDAFANALTAPRTGGVRAGVASDDHGRTSSGLSRVAFTPSNTFFAREDPGHCTSGTCDAGQVAVSLRGFQAQFVSLSTFFSRQIPPCPQRWWAGAWQAPLQRPKEEQFNSTVRVQRSRGIRVATNANGTLGGHTLTHIHPMSHGTQTMQLPTVTFACAFAAQLVAWHGTCVHPPTHTRCKPLVLCALRSFSHSLQARTAAFDAPL